MSISIVEKLGIAVKKSKPAISTNEMVLRCQMGDTTAFRLLFEKHVCGVHRHLSLLVGPQEDVDDLVQLVFLNVFQSIKRFEHKSAFSTWLFRITINIARQEIRQRSRARRLSGAVDASTKVVGERLSNSPEDQLENLQQVYYHLDKISYKKRETFVLYNYEGYSLEEIAILLDSSVSTIGSRLQAARRELLACMTSERMR